MPFRLAVGRRPNHRPRRRQIWSRDTTTRLLDRALDRIVRATDAGRGVDGQPLGRLANGEMARLRRTGDLIASRQVLKATRKGGQAGFPVRYAKYVFKRFPSALGFGPDFKDDVNAEIADALSAE